MFCIDYLLGYSSPSRKIVFLIRTGESVGERDRGPGSGRDTGGPSSEVSEPECCSQDQHTQSNTHTHTLSAAAKCLGSSKMDGSGSRNISSIVQWIKPGRKSISSG